MKKFICISPHQPPERFSKGIYKAVDNDKLIYESETGFPVIPAINGYAEANEEIEVITVVSDYDNAKKNYETFKDEINELAEKKNIKVKQVPITIPYDESIMLSVLHGSNHKFELYSGERLEDMVASIKENGVLSPIIVQPIEDGYEILIGHNRWNASKLAGLPTVPAIVKTDLTEEEAEMYVIESNVMQRGFENLRISEQAAAVALRHSEMFSQGKRNDILRELAHLENPSAEPDSSTLNPVGSKLDTSESVGKEYGVSKGSVVRLIRINRLIDELKALVDSGELSIRAGVELSFLSDDTQAVVAECTEDCKIDMKKAKMLRASADDEGNIDRYTVESIISGEDGKAKPKPKSVKISNDTYTKYFSEGVKAKEITETIEKALAFYFENMEEN